MNRSLTSGCFRHQQGRLLYLRNEFNTLAIIDAISARVICISGRKLPFLYPLMISICMASAASNNVFLKQGEWLHGEWGNPVPFSHSPVFISRIQ
nr:hypothetical protein [Paenibacillus sp. L3-i20]